MVGDASAVTVEDAGNEEHAQPWAQLWCARYSKTARFTATSRHHHGRYAESIDVQYECVGPM